MNHLGVFVGLVMIALPSATSTGQSSAKPIEIGFDAAPQRQTTNIEGAFGRDGSVTVTSIALPTQTVRVGFFASERLSIEPYLGMQYFKSEDSDSYTLFNLGVGALYHFSANAAKARPYVRPVVGVIGNRGEDDSETATLFGAGIGVKLPMMDRLAFQAEANFTRRLKSDDIPASDIIGLSLGLSFFTR